ncbi:MAG: hypothetical protein ACE5I5_13865, partial [Candidatus Heimdallarchaeota archaeon]
KLIQLLLYILLLEKSQLGMKYSDLSGGNNESLLITIMNLSISFVVQLKSPSEYSKAILAPL